MATTTFTTQDGVTKDQLTAMKRGKGGSNVVLGATVLDGILAEPQWRDKFDGTFRVSYLYDTKAWIEAGTATTRVAVVANLKGGGTTGFACSVDLWNIVKVLPERAPAMTKALARRALRSAVLNGDHLSDETLAEIERVLA